MKNLTLYDLEEINLLNYFNSKLKEKTEIPYNRFFKENPNSYIDESLNITEDVFNSVFPTLNQYLSDKIVITSISEK